MKLQFMKDINPIEQNKIKVPIQFQEKLSKLVYDKHII